MLARRILEQEILGGRYTLKDVSTDYTASNNEFILVDASAAAVTITLPPPMLNARVTVKKIDDSANAVTVDGNGAPIDGAATKIIGIQWEGYEFYCDGSEWYVI